MAERIDYHRKDHGGFKAMYGLENYVRSSPLDPTIRELVKIRASQINGCAFCLDMHWKEARANGETEARLAVLSAWHEAPFFSARERAALAWTEALTLVSQTHAPDEVYTEVASQFEEAELLDLTYAIVTINAWNRLAIGFRSDIKMAAP